MKFIKALTFLIIVILVGCAGNHCIKVGGEYQGVTGDVEYCWSSAKANEAGVPVIEGSDNTYFGFTEEQVNKILDKIKGKGKELGILAAPKEKQHPVKELLNKIKE